MREAREGRQSSLTAAGATDVGRQRDHNEDSFALVEEHGLYIVADGMGGHSAGDVASRLATESVAEFFRQTDQEDATWPAGFNIKLSEEENRLITGVRVANRRVFERSLASQDLRGMGTTVVCATLSKDQSRIAVAHVGDSRAYRVRQGKIEQLTRDHSLLSDMLLAMPDMSDEQRAELPKNVVTRALGVQDSVTIDIGSFDVQGGDVYVLCSDGLSGMVTDEEIRDVVLAAGDPDAACQRLVEIANDHGGDDNVTAIVLRIGNAAVQSEDTLIPPPPDSRSGASL